MKKLLIGIITVISVAAITITVLAGCNGTNTTPTLASVQANAKQLALTDAGIASAANVTVTTETEQNDKGEYVVDMDFEYDGTRYDYTVKIEDSTILEKKSTPSDELNGNITLEAAKKAAFDHAELTENQVSICKAKLDYDDGKYEYDIEFVYGGYEFEYEIDAKTGAVLQHEREALDTVNPTLVEQEGLITPDAAKAAALLRASLTGASVIFEDISLEYERNVRVYEINFMYDGYEYEVEVNAKTGEAVRYDKERAD